MKKTIIIFVIAALVLIPLALWALNVRGDIQEVLMISVVFLLVGFAVLVGINRLKSHRNNEAPEDELSKKVMTKASSLSFYISIYFWLVMSYISDRVSLETHSLIGMGIVGMSVIFFLSWLGIKIFGLKNE